MRNVRVVTVYKLKLYHATGPSPRTLDSLDRSDERLRPLSTADSISCANVMGTWQVYVDRTFRYHTMVTLAMNQQVGDPYW